MSIMNLGVLLAREMGYIGNHLVEDIVMLVLGYMYGFCRRTSSHSLGLLSEKRVSVTVLEHLQFCCLRHNLLCKIRGSDVVIMEDG